MILGLTVTRAKGQVPINVSVEIPDSDCERHDVRDGMQKLLSEKLGSFFPPCTCKPEPVADSDRPVDIVLCGEAMAIGAVLVAMGVQARDLTPDGRDPAEITTDEIAE